MFKYTTAALLIMTIANGQDDESSSSDDSWSRDSTPPRSTYWSSDMSLTGSSPSGPLLESTQNSSPMSLCSTTSSNVTPVRPRSSSQGTPISPHLISILQERIASGKGTITPEEYSKLIEEDQRF